MLIRRLLSTFTLLAATTSLGLLFGCSSSFTPGPVDAIQVPIGSLQGHVHGGQSPVAGGSIYLYQTGTTGYGSASTSLICNASLEPQGFVCPSNAFEDGNGNYYVQTDSNGNFALSGDYVCTAGSQVYMVATGGNPGLPGTVNNPYLVQMAGLGQCPTAGNLAAQDPYVTLNEITTVAFAYSMAAYGSNATNIGSPNTTQGLLGIANAMANARNIVNTQNGQPPATTLNSGSAGTVPVAKIISLANLLATCVNTDGTLYTSTTNGRTTTYSYNGCFNLFYYTTGATKGNNTNAPTVTGSPDESQAIFYIASNPTNNVLNLYNQIPTSPVFGGGGPTPNDWTLPIVFNGAVSVLGTTNGSYTSGPFNMAADATGAVWVGDRTKGVVEITPLGHVSTYSSGFTTIKGVAVAPNGNIWAADYGAKKVYILSSAGSVQKTLTSPGFSGPAAIAFDGSTNAANAYIVNETGNSVTVFDPTGSNVLGQVALTSVTTPASIAIDKNGTAWSSSTSNTTIGKVSYSATTGLYTASTITGTASGDYWIGFDSTPHMWVEDINGNTLDKGTKNGTSYKFATGGDYSGGGVSTPAMGAIDGAGTIWLPNDGRSGTATYISAFNGATNKFLSTGGFDTGASTGGTLGAFSAAVDISGDVWVGNGDGSVSELLGLATPTAAPLAPSNAGTAP